MNVFVILESEKVASANEHIGERYTFVNEREWLKITI